MSIDPTQVDGRTLLVLLVRTDANYREQFAWFGGKAELRAGTLSVHRGDAGPPLTVPGFALDRIQVCDEAMGKAFEPCDYLLSLRVEADDDSEIEAFDHVGLVWES